MSVHILRYRRQKSAQGLVKRSGRFRGSEGLALPPSLFIFIFSQSSVKIMPNSRLAPPHTILDPPLKSNRSPRVYLF